MKLSGLYVITDDNLLSGNQLYAYAKAALSGGARLLQYRTHENHAQTKFRHAQQLHELTQEFGAEFIVNNDLDLAIKLKVGLHVGQSDTPIEIIRDQLSEGVLFGVTCHNRLDLALQAQKLGASYIGVGRLFESKTKAKAPLATLSQLKILSEQIQIPIAAIGGITLDKVAEVKAHGASMVAMVHEIFAQNDEESVFLKAKSISAFFE